MKRAFPTTQDYTRERGVSAAQRHNRPSAPPMEGHGPDDDGSCAPFLRGWARVWWRVHVGLQEWFNRNDLASCYHSHH